MSGFTYRVSDEQLFAYAALPVDAKLAWLDEMQRLSWSFASPEVRARWRTLRRARPVLELDGARVTSLDAFYDEVSRVLIPGTEWGRNLDAFNDILRGGFGTPAGGFVLRWCDSARSRDALGPAMFDDVVDIIATHGPGGDEAIDGVDLELA